MGTNKNTPSESSRKDRGRYRSRSANRNAAAKGGTSQEPEAPGLRSYDRVRKLGEVFTAEREVNDMLDMVAECFKEIDSRFLEPSCGNGNFLVAILKRKIDLAFANSKTQKDYEYFSIAALASIYGIDIDLENVQESRLRMRALLLDSYSYKLNTARPTRGYFRAVDYVLDRNIVHGDFLNGTDDIHFTEFTSVNGSMFGQKVFRLSDLLIKEGSLELEASPIFGVKPKHYWELANK